MLIERSLKRNIEWKMHQGIKKHQGRIDPSVNGD